MSENENKFIRQLKIVLISVLGPFIIVGLLNAVADHHRIKTNKEAIEVIRKGYVDQKLMVRYYDELRRLAAAIEQEQDAEISRINDRLDILTREVYKHSTRGVPQELQTE